MHFPRGSEWRLWDLHIHTPASFSYQGGTFRGTEESIKKNWLKQIAENINRSDRAVYAINDYWTFEGYLALKRLSGGADVPALKKTVFPGIELRIESASEHRLNIHVLFSEDTTEQQLSDFKTRLLLRQINRPPSDEAFVALGLALPESVANKHGFTGDYRTSNDQLFRLGCTVGEVTKNSFEDALATMPANKRVVMIPYDCYGGMEDIDWAIQPLEDLYFMRMAQIVETRNPKNIEIFSGKRTPQNTNFFDSFMKTIGTPKPCVSGSDGHSIESFYSWRNETAAKKTWIKADPTFEGLRQIMFEPNERVRIQVENPANAFEKSYFNSISIANQISLYGATEDSENPCFAPVSELPLNSNMVCIIGGRGTGKSRLIDYLGRAFGGVGKADEDAAYNYASDFKIVFNKDLVSGSEHVAADRARLPFVYISQSEVKERVSYGKVGDELRRMLEVDVDTREEILTGEVSELHRRVTDQQNWFDQKDAQGNLVNDESAIKQDLIGYRSLLESITTETNKEKLERFTSNVNEIAKASEKNRQMETFVQDLRSVAERLNLQAQRIDARIPLVSFDEHLAAIDALKQESAELTRLLTLDNDQIHTEFLQIYTGDLSTLLSNAEAYRTAIERGESKLREIQQKSEDLEAAQLSRRAIAGLIQADLQRQITQIDSRWSAVQEGRSDWSEAQKQLMRKILSDRQISLSGVLVFKVDIFLKRLKERINLSYFKSSRDTTVDAKILDKFPVLDSSTWFKFVEMELHKVDQEEFVIGDLVKMFYDPQIRSEYLFVEPRISYRGRPLEKLSVGQRGTVYLCLKLATQAFTQPLIFDQPEDDLDNEFIISELVDIFRGIKQFRQVILITHNANIVVNSDAEQVVVAENDAGLLSYRSGSLEYGPINSDVRHILEGGDMAFRKREQRYAFAITP